jgi:AraC-like DNA-binding protein
LLPSPGQTILSFTSFIILLGVVQGILLTITWLFKNQIHSRLKGFLFLSITCIITEIFLNRTGYMYSVIQLVDFSEPLQFAIPPLFYLSILSLVPGTSSKKWWWHFIPFMAYLLYFIPFYLAPASYKQESFYFIHHLVEWKSAENFDFFQSWGKLRMYQLEACYLQTTIYLVLSFQKLVSYKNNQSGNTLPSKFEISWWFTFCITYSMLILVVIVVKVTYERDLGDHIIASFYTLIIYISTLSELRKLPATNHSQVQMEQENESPRYLSSGLKEEKKSEIQQKLISLMEEKKLYTDSLLSLSKVAKHIGEPAYMVSQVINERMGHTFFDWIAKYRVEEAQRLLSESKTAGYTIEQIAEEVGYNSKSAFNKAFKKFSGKTPSEYKSS